MAVKGGSNKLVDRDVSGWRWRNRCMPSSFGQSTDASFSKGCLMVFSMFCFDFHDVSGEVEAVTYDKNYMVHPRLSFLTSPPAGLMLIASPLTCLQYRD